MWIKFDQKTDFPELIEKHAVITEHLEDVPGASTFPWYQMESTQYDGQVAVLALFNTDVSVISTEKRIRKAKNELIEGDWHYKFD